PFIYSLFYVNCKKIFQMKRKTLIILTTVVGMTLQSCNKDKQMESSETQNPLIEAWETPFEVPPFEEIKIEHYKPAFSQAIEEHKNEIDAIAKNTESADFDNTIVALENAGQLLNRVSTVFFNLKSS